MEREPGRRAGTRCRASQSMPGPHRRGDDHREEEQRERPAGASRARARRRRSRPRPGSRPRRGGRFGHRADVSSRTRTAKRIRRPYTNTRSLDTMALAWRPTSSSSTAPGSTTSRTSPSGSRGTRSSASPGSPGSGKSSLAFDTIYAEGQRRYVESLSRLRAPVPADDGEAGRRLDRRAQPGDLDRPEDDVAQPALDRRHRHRDLRLPAPALRARRAAALPGLRPADRRASRSTRSSSRSSRCPRARASRSTRRSSATARASTATCSRSCATRASRASRSTASSTRSTSRRRSTRSSSTRSRSSSTGS